MASKYDALADYLRRQSGPRHTVGFAEIERIIGGPLPPSARPGHPAYPTWWQNTYSAKRRHVQATHGWHAAGWDRESLDERRETVTFRKRE